MPPPRKMLGYTHVLNERWKLAHNEEAPEITTEGGNHVTHVGDYELAHHIVAIHNAAIELANVQRGRDP
ncbi:MAG: hypothetical protein WD063_02870 [Pirellulales bacterium]